MFFRASSTIFGGRIFAPRLLNRQTTRSKNVSALFVLILAGVGGKTNKKKENLNQINKTSWPALAGERATTSSAKLNTLLCFDATYYIISTARPTGNVLKFMIATM